MKGYKYRGIEDDFDRDFETLLNNQIYAPPFIDLNDPFEGIYNDKITKLSSTLESVFNVDTSKVISSLEEIKGFHKRLGIYSLSATYFEELMWAHYANSHKGFCLEYKITKLKDNYLVPEMVNELKVDYKCNPQNINYSDIKKKDGVLKKLFATKSINWKYEKEIRLIFDSIGLKDYHPSALTGIYFGTRFCSEMRRQFIDSLTDRDICFYEMYRDENSYKLKRRLVHENKRTIQKKMDSDVFEIVSTSHNPKVENFNVFYKGRNIDQDSLSLFFDSFREKFATKGCNISLFDDKSVISLIDKNPLNKREELEVAKHFVAMSSFDSPNSIFWYPYKDS